MHDIAIFWVAAKNVGDNLAESLRIEAFVDLLYRAVDIFFGS